MSFKHPFLQLVCPEKVLLNYQLLEDEQPKICPYKPSGPHSSRLRKIVLEVTLPSEFDTPLFDFSSVPNATIKAQFYLNVTYDRYIPVSTSLPVFFVYDPDLWDEGRVEEI